MGNTIPQYYWVAYYQDGNKLKQFEEDGSENLFDDIEQDRLKAFAWVPRNDSKPTYSLRLQDWQRLIALRRHYIDGVSGKEKRVVYMLGWQATIDGSNYKAINFIFPDGSVITSDSLNRGEDSDA